MPENETKAVTIAEALSNEQSLLAILDQDAKGSATAEQIREQMGSQEPRLERIAVKHSGANMVIFPDGSPVKGEDGFTCIVLASNFHNAKYKHAFDDPDREEGERPECKSSDGVTPDSDVAEPKSTTCGGCQLNCSATNQKARDIAFSKSRDERCQNRLSLVVQVPGCHIPYIMDLSPSSFGAFASYAQRVGGQTRFLLHEVATKVTFKKVGQYGHSEAMFKYLGALPAQLRKTNEEANKAYVAYLRRTAIADRVAEEENSARAAAAKEASSTTDEAPL